MRASEDDDETGSTDDETASLLKAVPFPRGPHGHRTPRGKQRALGLWATSTLTYFSVCGGPFGLEVAVAAAGPLAVVGSIVILTLFWALPAAVLTAELSCALPAEGGYMHWVGRAFGPKCGALSGWLTVLNGFVDASTYPVMFVDYLCFGLQRWWGSEPLGPLTRWSVSASLTVLVCVLNARGLAAAAKLSIFLAVFSLLPFLLVVPAALLQGDGLHLGQPPEHPDLLLLFSVGMWCTSGFDSVSLVGGEVDRAAQTLPAAMGIALFLMISSTAGPVLLYSMSAAASTPWELGSFAVFVEQIGGRVFGVWIAAAAMASSVGLLNSFMCTSTRAVEALATQGMLPAGMRPAESARSHSALLFSGGGVLCLLLFPFRQLVELDMSLCACTLGVEVLALLRLRHSEPLLHRPFRLPLHGWMLVAFYAPSLGLCVMLLAMSFRQPSACIGWTAALCTGIIMVECKRRCSPSTYIR
mmetsp:Transcript_24890/g.53707  ORF Transcript_24890/g.53707 Transcript_24890/m.53707 type:complete len:471 (-) Transcript_24890:13-1425(-)